MSDVAVRVEGLGKRYRIGAAAERHDNVRDALAAAVKAPFRNLSHLRGLSRFGGEEEEENTVWALKDVSFEVKQGEVLGIIGRNGAGKSTLLKILSRITEPTNGRVQVHGRVGALLEVGTGFHPELTGRENVYLNGSILGMDKRYIDRKFDEIVEFSGVEKFIDTPVKRYSSGMYLRLAFSVAAHLEPEILVVDEVLAVGDAEFQKKCLGKMGEVAGEGRTVLFVSHQLDMIRGLSDRAVLLNSGRSQLVSDVDEVVAAYVSTATAGSEGRFTAEPDARMPLQVLNAAVVGADGQPRTQFDMFEDIRIHIRYVVRQLMAGMTVNFEIVRNGSTILLSFDTDVHPERLQTREPGVYEVAVELPRPLLKPGHYTIGFNAGIANITAFQRSSAAIGFRVDLHSRASAFLSYAEKRPGQIAVELPWEQERLSAYV